MQNNQNPNQKAKNTITKPTTRLAAKYVLINMLFRILLIIQIIHFSLNRTTISTNVKVKPSLNTSKTVLKVSSGLNENVSNIPKAIARPKAVGLVKSFRGTLTRSSSLRNKSVSKFKIHIQFRK